MFKRITLFVFAFSLAAVVVVSYAKNSPSYVYQFPLNIKSPKELNEDFQKQVYFYQKKLKRDPTNFQDMTNIAKLYSAHGKSSGFNKYFQLAHSYASKSIRFTRSFNTAACYILADIAQSQHQFPKSINYAQKILKEKPRSPEAFLILVKANLVLGHLVEANRYADELISVMPNENAYTLRAMVLSAQGRDDEAILDFDEALGVEENDPEQASFTRVTYAHFYITKYYSKKKSQYFAEKLLGESLRLTPNSSLALGLMGDLVIRNSNNYKAAIGYYKQAFAQSKQMAYLLKEARANKLMGENAFAFALYKQTENLLRNELSKNKKVLRSDLIRLLLERGNSKDYPEAMKLALNDTKIRANSETLILLSWALEMNNHLSEARRVVRDALAKNYRSEEIYLRAISIEGKLNNSSLVDLYRNNYLTSSL